MLINNSSLLNNNVSNNAPLLLDGALGSLLLERNVKCNENSWITIEALKEKDILLSIHKEYIDAGADIITTNTFRSNPAALVETPFKSEKIVRESLKIAKEAKGSSNVLIAGCNAPAEDCYSVIRWLKIKELKFNHHKHISLLMENGADFVLNETFSHFDEIKIASDYCFKNNIPYIMSFYLDEYFNLMSEDNLDYVLKYVQDRNPLMISFNCIKPEIFIKNLDSLNLNCKWGVYFNVGLSNVKEGIINEKIPPDEYADICKSLLKYNPALIGSCCGSNPGYTKKLREMLDKVYENYSSCQS